MLSVLNVPMSVFAAKKCFPWEKLVNFMFATLNTANTSNVIKLFYTKRDYGYKTNRRNYYDNLKVIK